MIYVIAAVDENLGIGKDGTMPWHFSKELKHFAQLTTQTHEAEDHNAVIMGRKTWESIPKKFRPLPGRRNIVLTRNADFHAQGADVCQSLDEAIELAEDCEKTFIIGGGSIYEQALQHQDLNGIYLTRIQKSYDCDTFFPQLPEEFSQKIMMGEMEEKGITFHFELLKKPNP